MAEIDDPERIDALKATGLLDSDPDPTFDRFTVLGSRLLDAPVSLVSLVDDDRQFLKSARGLPDDVRETSLPVSFCKHVVTQEAPVVVGDAREDPRFADHPGITALDVVAYLGYPLSTPDGPVLGSFCVIDSEPRSWTEEDVDSVQKLAEAVMTEIELRRALGEVVEREEALRRSEEHYRRLLRTAPNGIFALDEEGRFVELNREGETLLGRPADDVMGMHFQEVLDPRDRGVAESAFDQLIRREQEMVELELAVVHPSGERRLLHLSASPIEDGFRGFQGVARDITERREQEKHHRRTERLASLGTLISGVAHELNNPLAAIRGFSQILLEDVRDADEREMLETIAREADRSSQIVKELRLLARTVRSEPSEAVDVNDIVRHVLKVRSTECEEHDIQVKIDLAESLPPVRGVRARLEQVVMNLVVNAEQALTGIDRERNLIVRTRRGAGDVSISIFDNGPGIPPEELDRIFDPFFSTKEEQGTGLGLSLVHKIVTEHDGRIDVESEPDDGVLFTVHLPAAQDASPVDEPSAAPASADRRPLRVLVVEDEAPIRRVLDAMLTRMGHRVSQARDGEEALRILEETAEPYDLILSDLRMPGMSGGELRERVLEMDPAYTDRVAFVSGDVNAPEALRIIESSAAPFIEKPFEQRDLEELVEWVVDRSNGT
ncbi:MAG: PAS domain S-box protein [Longimicrobiales bacterium]|nr:PAS domain S-box protein [Longimicrobiales bacterium]